MDCSLMEQADMFLPTLQEVFILFIWTFRLLETANSPLFTKCLSILELIGQVTQS